MNGSTIRICLCFRCIRQRVTDSSSNVPPVPTKSILRDANIQFPVINPKATLATEKIRLDVAEEYDLDVPLRRQATSTIPLKIHLAWSGPWLYRHYISRDKIH
jgi:hypothetical protein